jgi:membrane carboxypeptidase/penicillin-binding protein
VGFSNDVTIAVWVGYDNGDGQRRTLGDGETGNGVAVPIFEEVMQSVWANLGPRTILRGPSAEAQRQLVDLPIDPGSGTISRRKSGGFIEHFHLNAQGKLDDPRAAMASANGSRRWKDKEQETRKSSDDDARKPRSARSPRSRKTSTARATVSRPGPSQPQQPAGWFGFSSWGNYNDSTTANRGGWWINRH